MLLQLVISGKADYEKSRLRVIRDRDYLLKALGSIEELIVFPSHANFVYIKLAAAFNGDELRSRLLKNQGCFVRNCGNSLRSNTQNRDVFDAFA